MQKREGRSYAPPPPAPMAPDPGRTGRKRWERPDVSRSTAPMPVSLPTTDAMVSEIDEPEEADADEVFGLLSVEARGDVLADSLGGIGGGAL